MLDLIRNFYGVFKEDSIGATVYSYWHYHYYTSFMKILEEFDPEHWDKNKRILLMDHYAFFDFYQKLLIKLSTNSPQVKYEKLCKNGFNQTYQGEH
jgi:hypothetical protein